MNLDEFDKLSIDDFERLSPAKRELVSFLFLKSINCDLKKNKCAKCNTTIRLRYLAIFTSGIGVGLGWVAKALYAHVGGK